MKAAFTSANPGRLRRQITSGLVALSLSLGMVAATARPAHAASYVEGCFRSSDGSLIEGVPFHVQAYWQGKLYTIATGKLGYNGCGSYAVPANLRNYPLMFVVGWTSGGYSFNGYTPIVAWPGEGRQHLGRGLVTITRR